MAIKLGERKVSNGFGIITARMSVVIILLNCFTWNYWGKLFYLPFRGGTVRVAKHEKKLEATLMSNDLKWGKNHKNVNFKTTKHFHSCLRWLTRLWQFRGGIFLRRRVGNPNIHAERFSHTHTRVQTINQRKFVYVKTSKTNETASAIQRQHPPRHSSVCVCGYWLLWCECWKKKLWQWNNNYFQLNRFIHGERVLFFFFG